jgi:hypothetical protein
LAKWIIETTNTQGLNTTVAAPSASQDADAETSDEGDSSSEDEEGDETEIEDSQVPIIKSMTMGLMQMADGELLIETTDFADIDELFAELEDDDSGEGND